jgi:hypothetical protein
VLSDRQKALDTANASKLLKTLVDVVCTIAELYPTSFQPHFQDIADVIIGWCIDASQERNIQKCFEEALAKFQPFWIANLEFTLNLLSQFLEDADAYAEDLGSAMSRVGRSNDYTNPEDCLEKLPGLFRVFHVILSSMKDFLIISPENAENLSFATTSLNRMISCIGAVLDSGFEGVNRMIKSGREQLIPSI